MAFTFPRIPAKPLLLCSFCNLALRLLGIEPESEQRDLFTFECIKCGRQEVRGVRLR
jgi:hypothetical protein